MVKTDITVVYYTDNKLDKKIFDFCRQELIKSAGGLPHPKDLRKHQAYESVPIISVSQEPMDLGTNICVPGIGSSFFSMFKQMIIGLKAVKTKYVAFAEHDCLYTPEHFRLRPLTEDNIYYNTHHWFVDWETGEYSYRRSKPFSQLISVTETALVAIQERLDMANDGAPEYVLSEPGMKDWYPAFKAVKKSWCATKKVPYRRYRAGDLKTICPNLDIRHGTNLTRGRGPRRYTDIYELPHWGNFKDYINGHSLS